MATREARVDAAIDEAERLRRLVDDLHAYVATETARLSDQVKEGRRIAHEIKNELQAAVGTMSLIQSEGQLTDPQKDEVIQAVDRLVTVSRLVDSLHQLVRGLEPQA